MSQRVLIGFADALAAIESAWSLADDGFEVVAFARRGTRPALGRDRRVRIVPITPPEQDARRAAADIAAAMRATSPIAVLPLDDHAVWLCDQVFADPSGHETRTTGVVLAGPIGPAAVLALDKRQQLAAAQAAGFAVPRSADAATESPPGPGPWMVKPSLAVELRDGRLHRPVGRIATTAAEVRDIAAAIGGPAIAQPLISGTGEGIFGLATPGCVVALSAHRRIRMMNPRGSGSSACRSIPVPANLAAPVTAFIIHSKLTGLFMVELLRDGDGRPWFMELNGRAWGSMALACRRGYAYPAWAVQSALQARFVPAEPVAGPDLTARHLGREMVHVAAVLARGGAPRLTTVRDVLTFRRDDRWYNWRRRRVAVFAADTAITLRSQLHRGRSA